MTDLHCVKYPKGERAIQATGTPLPPLRVSPHRGHIAILITATPYEEVITQLARQY
jgi:hypothetical protein